MCNKIENILAKYFLSVKRFTYEPLYTTLQMTWIQTSES